MTTTIEDTAGSGGRSSRNSVGSSILRHLSKSSAKWSSPHKGKKTFMEHHGVGAKTAAKHVHSAMKHHGYRHIGTHTVDGDTVMVYHHPEKGAAMLMHTPFAKKGHAALTIHPHEDGNRLNEIQKKLAS